MAKNPIAKDYGETSLEAMLHDGKNPYLHMRRQVLLESSIRIRQFRREWFAALKLLFGKTPTPQGLGVDTSGASTYWAQVHIGLVEHEEGIGWVYRLKVSRNALLAPAINRTEIIAHELAHLLDYYNKYIKGGLNLSRHEIRKKRIADILAHSKDWQAIYKRFYKKLKAANIVEADSEYEKHAAMLLEKRRQAWADPEWRDGYKARMQEGQGKKGKTRKKAKSKPPLTGRVKAHRRRTEKGKSVAVHGYQRKPRRD